MITIHNSSVKDSLNIWSVWCRTWEGGCVGRCFPFLGKIFHLILTGVQWNKQINIQLRVNSSSGILQDWKETNYFHLAGFSVAGETGRTFLWWVLPWRQVGWWSGARIISALRIITAVCKQVTWVIQTDVWFIIHVFGCHWVLKSAGNSNCFSPEEELAKCDPDSFPCCTQWPRLSSWTWTI